MHMKCCFACVCNSVHKWHEVLQPNEVKPVAPMQRCMYGKYQYVADVLLCCGGTDIEVYVDRCFGFTLQNNINSRFVVRRVYGAVTATKSTRFTFILMFFKQF